MAEEESLFTKITGFDDVKDMFDGGGKGGTGDQFYGGTNKEYTTAGGTDNNKDDNGIKQTWLFAHPDNKKITGPYERFRIMIYGQQYKFLINHSSHKINLITNSPNRFIYRIEILSDKKQLFFYEWHVQKGSEEKCKNCWFTSAVSIPVDQGNTI